MGMMRCCFVKYTRKRYAQSHIAGRKRMQPAQRATIGCGRVTAARHIAAANASLPVTKHQQIIAPEAGVEGAGLSNTATHCVNLDLGLQMQRA